MLGGPRARRAIVEFHPDVTAHQTGLRVGYGVSTQAHRQFRATRGVRHSEWPHVTESLLHGAVLSPEFARSGAPGRIPPDTWILGDEQHTTHVGAALVGALKHDILPRLESWFDPEMLADALADRPAATFPGLAPRPRAVAMALYEVGDAEERLRATLERLPSDDMVREWIEAQLATRPAT